MMWKLINKHSPICSVVMNDGEKVMAVLEELAVREDLASIQHRVNNNPDKGNP